MNRSRAGPPRRLTRRQLLRGLAATAIGAPVLQLRAQPGDSFPARTIMLWVPWPAGGATDLTMRLLAELAGRHLGQKIAVDNRPGAGGTLAMPILQQAAPDGYTIAQMPQPVLRAPWLQKLLWDPVRDSSAIIQLSGVTFGMLTQPDSGLKSLNDVFAFAQAHPGALTVATNGVGTTPHLAMDELMSRQRLSYVHVPYKGTAEQMLAVAAGQVMIGLNSTGFAPYVDSGRLRLLLTLGEHRTRRWPQVPTLKEMGHGIVAMSPYGLAGPRGMSAAVVQTLHDAFRTALFDPMHLAELARYDQEPAYLGTDDYARALRDGYAAEKRNVERLGLARGG